MSKTKTLLFALLAILATGPALASGGGSGVVPDIPLGTNTSNANPHIIGDYTSGEFTNGAGHVDVAVGGLQIADWTTAGEHITGVLTVSGGITMSGLTTGTQVSCVGLDSGNHLVLSSGACGTGGGAVSSVFARTGAVVATSGDYTVSQVTGAAPLASPTFTGTVTLPAGQVVNGVTLNGAGSASLFLNQAGGYTTPSGAGGLTVASTTITSGTTTRVLFDNAGVLGEYVISGTGNVAMTTSPVFTTPNLGVPSAATLTNATGLPISTGVSGLGTGVATLLSGTSSGTGGPAGTASPTFTGTINGAAAIWSGLDTAASFSATGTGANQLPVGTTAQRPSASAGMIRYNSSGTPAVEAYVNSQWQQLGLMPDRTATTGTTIAVGDMGGQVNLNGSSLTVTIPAISSTVLPANQNVLISNQNGSALTISTTPTINGYPGTSIGQYGWLGLTSNGTSLDGFGFPGFGTITSNAIEKFSGTSGIATASALSDNGTVVSIAGEAAVAASSTPALSTSTFTPNFNLANIFDFALVHASCPCTIANPSALTANQSGVIEIDQSSTGSDTVTWGSEYKFAGGTAPTLSTGASAQDYFSYVVKDSTHIIVSGGILNAH